MLIIMDEFACGNLNHDVGILFVQIYSSLTYMYKMVSSNL
jgi:hypothetical protein